MFILNAGVFLGSYSLRVCKGDFVYLFRNDGRTNASCPFAVRTPTKWKTKTANERHSLNAFVVRRETVESFGSCLWSRFKPIHCKLALCSLSATTYRKRPSSRRTRYSRPPRFNFRRNRPSVTKPRWVRPVHVVDFVSSSCRRHFYFLGVNHLLKFPSCPMINYCYIIMLFVRWWSGIIKMQWDGHPSVVDGYDNSYDDRHHHCRTSSDAASHIRRRYDQMSWLWLRMTTSNHLY